MSSVQTRWFDGPASTSAATLSLVDQPLGTAAPERTERSNLERELVELLQTEGRLSDAGISCGIRDHADSVCSACPLSKHRDSLAAVHPLCVCARRQEQVLTSLAVLRSA